MEQYTDLIEFKKEYEKKIENFLKRDNESRIVILDADYGWGKTTFVRDVLKVNEKNIYSPWMSQKKGYLDDLYYYTNNIDVANLTIKSFIIVIVISILIFFGTIFINDWVDLYKSSEVAVTFSIENGMTININEKNNLLKEATLLVGCSVTISLIVIVWITTHQIAYMKILKKEYSSNFEKKLIDKIIKKVDTVLVIEDIDRLDNIDEILILIKRISDRMIELHNKDKNQKYILLTGEYSRLINSLNKNYNISNGPIQSTTPGACIVEKIIGYRILFLSKEERIKNLLKEFNIDIRLTKIEKEEILNFINRKQLSARFFVNFLKEYIDIITTKNSLFYLLIEYYYKNRVVNLDEKIWEKSIFNIQRVPNCLNDIELILEKKEVKLCDKILSFENIGLENVNTNEQFNIININFRKIFIEKEKNAILIFKEFFNNKSYPILNSDKPNRPSGKYNIGNNAKPDRIKDFLRNYLISYGNNDDMDETMLREKRCYFNLYNTGNNYNKFFPDEVEKDKTKPVSNEDFVIAYIATFFRDNIKEISENYPEIFKIINNIIK